MFVRHATTILLMMLIASLNSADASAQTDDTLSSPIELPPGYTIYSGLLDGDVGRLDTLLGHYSGGFSSLLDVDDNGSTIGGSGASGLSGLPLESDNSIWLKVTGAGNTSFTTSQDFGASSSHSQLGHYQVYYDFFDAVGNFVDEKVSSVDSIEPGAVDLIMVQAPAEAEGGTVDVNINTIIGPGEGNAIDFLRFNDLTPGAPFTAKIVLTSIGLLPGLGYFDGENLTLIEAVQNEDPLVGPMISGIVPESGELLLAVTGYGDAQEGGFLGQHAEKGGYILEVVLVPEPGSALLFSLGLGLMGWFGRRRARR